MSTKDERLKQLADEREWIHHMALVSEMELQDLADASDDLERRIIAEGENAPVDRRADVR